MQRAGRDRVSGWPTVRMVRVLAALVLVVPLLPFAAAPARAATTLTNAGISVNGRDAGIYADGGLVLFGVQEGDEGITDLNGDGDTGDIVWHVLDTQTGNLHNLGLATTPTSSPHTAVFESGTAVVLVYELAQGATDLNGDGDTLDTVLHVWRDGTVINLAIAAMGVPQQTLVSGGALMTWAGGGYMWRPGDAAPTSLDLSRVAAADDGWFLYSAREPTDDWNGDGDTTDEIAFVWDSATNTTFNSGLAVAPDFGDIDDRRALVKVGENDQGRTDLNGDGDTSDFVAHGWDVAGGTTVNLGVASGLSQAVQGVGGGSFLFTISETYQGADGNGDGDTSDEVLAFVSAGATAADSLGLALNNSVGPRIKAIDGSALVAISEESQGDTDLNGDGDAHDLVVHAWTSESGLSNLGVATASSNFHEPGMWLSGNLYAVAVPEGPLDLNGDGDTADRVMFAGTVGSGVTNLGLETSIDTGNEDVGFNGGAGIGDGFLAFIVNEVNQRSDLNGDGDSFDRVLVVWDPVSGAEALPHSVGSRLAVNADGVVALGVDEDRVGDMNGDGDTSDFVLHYRVPNTPPTAVAGGPYSVEEGSSVLLDGTGSSDPDGTIASYLWTPSDNLDDATLAQPTFTGIDDTTVTLTLEVTDDDGATATDSTTVTVTNVAPTVNAGTDQTVTTGDTVTLDPATFTDPGTADTHTATIDWGDGTPTEPGTVGAGTIDASHTYPTAGTYTVTITVTDDDGATGTDTMTVTVANTPNTPPTAVDDQTVTRQGTSVVIDVLGNDTDADGDPLTVTNLSDPANGSVSLNPDGTVEYTPNSGFVGTDTFTYTASDGSTDSDPATVTVFVIPPNKLLASDGAADDQFGSAVAVSGDRIVIGAPFDDDNGNRSGAAYLYEPDGSGGWTETKLTASDGAADDWFGYSVAVSGDRIVIGAPFDDDNGTNSGSAYLYEPDGTGGWTETKLTASDAAAFDEFGWSVAVSGDRIVIGARYDDDNGSGSGSAYLYEPDGTGGWTETKLTASDGATGDQFGLSVAISGDRIVIGAPFDDDNGTNAGSAYLYQPDGTGGWTETKLTASDAATSDWFGWSVAVSGDRIVIGAPFDDDNGTNAGSAYLYQPDGTGGWTETKLTASDAATSDWFALSVAISDDRIVIGAPADDDNGTNAGSAYLYQPDGTGGWTETKLTASDGATGDQFGLSVAISDDRIVIGAAKDDDNGTNSGSAYVFELVASPNDPPTADAGGPYAIDEGSSIMLDGTGSSDADGTIASYLWTPADNLDDPTLLQPTFTGIDDAVVTMTLTVTDDDGATATATTTVAVNNVAPSVDAGTDQTVDDGDPVSLDPATFTDPGTADTHTATIDWGDGIVQTGTIDQSAGTVAGAHTYAGPGTFTVTITVTDDDGGVGSDSFNVTVRDVTPPVLTTPGDLTIEATGPDGAIVDFVVEATDDSDPAPSVECEPPPGALFPLGTSTVTCTATDASGNSTDAVFAVSVVVGSATFDGFAQLVRDLDVFGPFERFFVRAIEHAQLLFNAGKISRSIRTLRFIVRVADVFGGRVIAVDDARAIASAARGIIAALEAGS